MENKKRGHKFTLPTNLLTTDSGSPRGAKIIKNKS